MNHKKVKLTTYMKKNSYISCNNTVACDIKRAQLSNLTPRQSLQVLCEYSEGSIEKHIGYNC